MILQDVPTYHFQPPTYNGQTISPVLATNNTRWLCQYPLDLIYPADAETAIGFSAQLTGGLVTWTFNNNIQNYWGLPYLSAELAYGNGGSLATTMLSPGNSFQISGRQCLSGNGATPVSNRGI